MEDTLTANKGTNDYESIAACESDAYVPTQNGTGSWLLQTGRDNLPAVLRRVILEHDFLDAVKKSSGLPFEIIKDMNGIRINGTTQLGEKFYRFLGTPTVAAPKAFLLSEPARILRETITQMGLDNFQITGNPSSSVLPNGTLEGELVNAFVQRLREATKRKRFKSAVEVEGSQVAKFYGGFKRYVQRCSDINPHLQCLRMELLCPPSNLHSGESAEEAQQQITDLFSGVTKKLGGSMPGYWWKREFRSETGFSHHVILFWNTTSTPSYDALMQELHEQWNSLTVGNGRICPLSYSPTNYRTWGIGRLPFTSDVLHKSVKMMLNRDRYIRLASGDSFVPVGMGKLPKAIKKVNSGSFSQENSFTTSQKWPSFGI